MPVAAIPTKPPSPCSAPNNSLGSALCMQCGLCCTGALHDAAVLDPDEVSPALAIGLPVLDRKKPGFKLPCPKLEGTLCSIYGNRPRVCGRYQCKLLQELEAGEVSLSNALEHVKTAKTLAAQVQTAMPDGISLPQARAMRAPQSDAANRKGELSHGRKMELQLRTTALDLYLDKYFRNSRDTRMLELTAVEADGSQTEKR